MSKSTILGCEKCGEQFAYERDPNTVCDECGVLCDDCAPIHPRHRDNQRCPLCGGADATVYVPKDYCLGHRDDADAKAEAK